MSSDIPKTEANVILIGKELNATEQKLLSGSLKISLKDALNKMGDKENNDSEQIKTWFNEQKTALQAKIDEAKTRFSKMTDTEKASMTQAEKIANGNDIIQLGLLDKKIQGIQVQYGNDKSKVYQVTNSDTGLSIAEKEIKEKGILTTPIESLNKSQKEQISSWLKLMVVSTNLGEYSTVSSKKDREEIMTTLTTMSSDSIKSMSSISNPECVINLTSGKKISVKPIGGGTNGYVVEYDNKYVGVTNDEKFGQIHDKIRTEYIASLKTPVNNTAAGD